MVDARRSEATLLLQALEACQAVAPPRERIPGLTIDDAYAVQRELIGLRCAAGARRIGRKVGLTSRAMQEMLGVEQPDFGVLLDDMVVPERAGLDTSRLIAPRVEAEIAYVIGVDLQGPHVGPNEVRAATVGLRPALEVIDSRVADWNIAIEDTIADNASSGLVILGAERSPSEVDQLEETVSVRVGSRAVEGRGDAVLGDPAAAVAWLVRALARYDEGLSAGEIVIPGAMAAALPIAAGDTITANFSTLGILEVAVR